MPHYEVKNHSQTTPTRSSSILISFPRILFSFLVGRFGLLCVFVVSVDILLYSLVVYYQLPERRRYRLIPRLRKFVRCGFTSSVGNSENGWRKLVFTFREKAEIPKILSRKLCKISNFHVDPDQKIAISSIKFSAHFIRYFHNFLCQLEKQQLLMIFIFSKSSILSPCFH